MAMMNNLYKWLVYVGLDVLTLNGWSTRGSSNFAPTSTLAHWIAGPRNVKPGRRPSLSVIRDGHSTLPGPLSNDYMGRAGEVVLVAAGRCNHAGYGYWKGATGNTGLMGTEPEAADNNDWTPEQRKSYPLIKIAHLFAMWEKGLISWNQITSNRVAGHSEFALPKGRKVDVNGYTMPSMRKQIAALIPGFKKRVNRRAISVGTPAVFNRDTYKFTDGSNTAITPKKESWLDMATKKELTDVVRAEINRALSDTPDAGKKGTRSYRLRYHDMRSQLLYAADGGLRTSTILGRVSAIEDILDQIASGEGIQIDYDRVEKAAQEGVSKALKALEADVTLNVETE